MAKMNRNKVVGPDGFVREMIIEHTGAGARVSWAITESMIGGTTLLGFKFH